MMRSLLRIQVLIGKWTRALASVGFVALLVLAVLTTVDVLMRWIAGSTIRGLMDINQLVFIIGVASCMPLVVAEKGNISIRFLGERMHQRSATWLDAFGAATLLLFVVLIGWQLVLYVIELFESGMAPPGSCAFRSRRIGRSPPRWCCCASRCS